MSCSMGFFLVISDVIVEVSSLVDSCDEIFVFPFFFPVPIQQNFSPSKVYRISDFALVQIQLEVPNVGNVSQQDK